MQLPPPGGTLRRLTQLSGCVASQEGEALQKRAPYVDLVFGPQTGVDEVAMTGMALSAVVGAGLVTFGRQ